MASNLTLCAFCKNIPYSKLPSEDEAAHPHQPSLQALSASARQCQLCKLILDVVNELRKTFEDEKSGGGSHGFIAFNPTDKETGVATQVILGAAAPSRTRQPSGTSKPEEKGSSRSPTNGKDTQSTLSKIFHKKPGRQDVAQRRLSGLFHRKSEPYDVVRPWMFGNWWILHEEKVGAVPQYQLIGIGVRIGKTPYIGDAEGNDKTTVKHRGSQLRMRAMDDAPAAVYIPSRMRVVDCWSPIGMRRIRKWIDSCNTDHQCVPRSNFLPTRLLDLGQNPNSQLIKLVASQGITGAYVALSHCWGKSHRITSTTKTIETLQSGISLSDFPLTFQDAVRITKSLSIRYLWVDSLCIIQDDDVDWEHEASLMGSVYANAFLTIAASSSTDDASGCCPSLATRQNSPHVSPDAISMKIPSPGDVCPYLVETYGQEPVFLARQTLVPVTIDEPNARASSLTITKEWMPSSTKSKPSIYMIGYFGSDYDPLQQEPLNSRGWTLQERLLASRTLHYGSNQMFWECKNCLLAEDGTPFPTTFFTVESIIQGQMIPFTYHGLPKEGGGLNFIEGLYANTPHYARGDRGWLALIENYSRRNLTREEDKLPALAGLAKLLSERTGDSYMAGLWYRHLEEDLCWRVYAREEMLSCSGDAAARPQRIYGARLSDVQRPKKYRAPSWTWASIDAGVLFIQMNFDHIVMSMKGEYVEPVGTKLSLYGQLKAGWLQLQAPLLQLRPLGPGKQQLEPYGVPIEITCAAGVAPGTAHFDDLDAFPANFDCFALFLDWGNALIVTRTDGRSPEYPGGNDNEFQRKGKTGNEWKRIGLARFIWTPQQGEEACRGNEDLSDMKFRRGIWCHGPITDQDPKVLVTLI